MGIGLIVNVLSLNQGVIVTIIVLITDARRGAWFWNQFLIKYYYVTVPFWGITNHYSYRRIMFEKPQLSLN